MATEKQKELAWYAILLTVENKTAKHYNQKIKEDNDLRAMYLSRFLWENCDKPARLILYKYRQRFATFELLMELYGDELLDWDDSLTSVINRNKYYYMREVAQLQRKYQVWDVEQLTQLWLSESDESSRRINDVSDYRMRTIREMAEEVICRRWKQRVYGESQISPKDRRIAGL